MSKPKYGYGKYKTIISFFRKGKVVYQERWVGWSKKYKKQLNYLKKMVDESSVNLILCEILASEKWLEKKLLDNLQELLGVGIYRRVCRGRLKKLCVQFYLAEDDIKKILNEKNFYKIKFILDSNFRNYIIDKIKNEIKEDRYNLNVSFKIIERFCDLNMQKINLKNLEIEKTGKKTYRIKKGEKKEIKDVIWGAINKSKSYKALYNLLNKEDLFKFKGATYYVESDNNLVVMSNNPFIKMYKDFFDKKNNPSCFTPKHKNFFKSLPHYVLNKNIWSVQFWEKDKKNKKLNWKGTCWFFLDVKNESVLRMGVYGSNSGAFKKNRKRLVQVLLGDKVNSLPTMEAQRVRMEYKDIKVSFSPDIWVDYNGTGYQLKFFYTKNKKFDFELDSLCGFSYLDFEREMEND